MTGLELCQYAVNQWREPINTHRPLAEIVCHTLALVGAIDPDRDYGNLPAEGGEA